MIAGVVVHLPDTVFAEQCRGTLNMRLDHCDCGGIAMSELGTT